MSLRYCGALLPPVAITKSLNCAKSHASPSPIDVRLPVSVRTARRINKPSSRPPTRTELPELSNNCRAPLTTDDAKSAAPVPPEKPEENPEENPEPLDPVVKAELNGL